MEGDFKIKNLSGKFRVVNINHFIEPSKCCECFGFKLPHFFSLMHFCLVKLPFSWLSLYASLPSCVHSNLDFDHVDKVKHVKGETYILNAKIDLSLQQSTAHI
jgi:hypothetical protein